MKSIITKTFKPGTYKISHSGIYTYITYNPIDGSTIQSSMMIPDGSGEIIEIVNGVCNIIVSANTYFEQRGFIGIHSIDEVDEGVIRIYCDRINPNTETPIIRTVEVGYYPDDNDMPEECLQIIIEL